MPQSDRFALKIGARIAVRSRRVRVRRSAKYRAEPSASPRQVRECRLKIKVEEALYRLVRDPFAFHRSIVAGRTARPFRGRRAIVPDLRESQCGLGGRLDGL